MIKSIRTICCGYKFHKLGKPFVCKIQIRISQCITYHIAPHDFVHTEYNVKCLQILYQWLATDSVDGEYYVNTLTISRIINATSYKKSRFTLQYRNIQLLKCLKLTTIIVSWILCLFWTQTPTQSSLQTLIKKQM